MKNLILSLALLVGWAAPTQAQTVSLDIDAAAKYGLTYADGAKTTFEKYGAGQDTVRLKWAWTRWRNQGMTLATFRTRYVGCAALQDIAWTNEAPGNLKQGFQNTFTRADFTNMRGAWYFNATVQLPRGGYLGPSSFAYAGQGGDQGQVAGQILMDDLTWWTPPGSDTKERRLLETPNASFAGNLGYNESISVTKLMLTGPDKGEDGITRIGLFIKRAGEASKFDEIRADEFSYGIVFNDGVPVTFGTLSAFANSKCGVCGLGTALATIAGQTISGDDNAELFGLHPGYGSPGGGRVALQLLKSEGDVTEGRTIRNQSAGVFEGQYLVDIRVVNFSNGPRNKPPAMFTVNSTLGGGANQASLLNFQGIGFGYQKVLKNMVTGNEWGFKDMPGDWQAVGIEHYAKWDKVTTGNQDIVKNGGSVTPPPPVGACTSFTYVVTSTCPNGTWQSRSAIGSPSNCTTTAPPDSLVRTCTTTPSTPFFDRATWKPSAKATSASFPVAYAIDASTATRYGSGRAQAVGDWWQADMVTARSTSYLEISTTGSPWDFPVGGHFEVSTTGTSWTKVGTDIVGSYGVTTYSATFTARSVRYWRFVCDKAAASSWLSIYDANAK